jgi:hypothetical protein
VEIQVIQVRRAPAARYDLEVEGERMGYMVRCGEGYRVFDYDGNFIFGAEGSKTEMAERFSTML